MPARGSNPPTNLWRPGLAAVAVAILVGTTGGLLTDIGPWYRALAKPSWQPPDWLFGPVWTLIFTLTAIAFVVAWNGAATDRQRHQLARVFLANAVLNVVWSALFFALQRPGFALAEIVVLWLSIALMIAAAARASRPAGLLLVPYLAWVTFAAVLNAAIVRLNGIG